MGRLSRKAGSLIAVLEKSVRLVNNTSSSYITIFAWIIAVLCVGIGIILVLVPVSGPGGLRFDPQSLFVAATGLLSPLSITFLFFARLKLREGSISWTTATAGALPLILYLSYFLWALGRKLLGF